jgi:chaperone BCS1
MYVCIILYMQPTMDASKLSELNADTKAVETVETVETDEKIKIKINFAVLPTGHYEYFVESSCVIAQILSFMYNTIERVTPLNVPQEPKTIPFKVVRRPYKYDGGDSAYMILGYGAYRYEYKPGVVLTVTYTQESAIVGTQDAAEKYESLKIVSSSCKDFHDFYVEADRYGELNEKDDTKLHIFIMNKYGEWIRYNKIPSRTLKTVYFDAKVKSRIRKDIVDFIANEKEYDEFGIPYKKNYLLTGIPGSGKTSIVKALCKEIGYNLCIFSINHDIDNSVALIAFRDIPEKSLLLIEDIDCLFEKRTGTQDNKFFTFSNLLNLLDGVCYRKGLISFITTNHPENLDHALLRQGRTDMIIHMNYPKKTDVHNLFVDMMQKTGESQDVVDKSFEAFYKYIQSKHITMAGLVGFLFKYRMGWEENIDELLDTDKFIKEVTRNVENSKMYS